MLSALFVVGMVVAVVACWRANLLDRAEGITPTAPTGIMAALLALAVSSVVLHADEYIDTCSLLGDPSEMTWAEYLIWLAAGCFWP